MMLIAASCPSKSDAALTKRSGVVRPSRAAAGKEVAGVLMLDSGRKVHLDYTQPECRTAAQCAGGWSIILRLDPDRLRCSVARRTRRMRACRSARGVRAG